LGGDNWKINSRCQIFGFKETKDAIHGRHGGWDSRGRVWWLTRARRGHDDWSHFDATVSGVHDK
jgi:hypothetical protein